MLAKKVRLNPNEVLIFKARGIARALEAALKAKRSAAVCVENIFLQVFITKGKGIPIKKAKGDRLRIVSKVFNSKGR